MGYCSGKCCLYSVEFAKGMLRGKGRRGAEGEGKGGRRRERLILKFTKCTKQKRNGMKKRREGFTWKGSRREVLSPGSTGNGCAASSFSRGALCTLNHGCPFLGIPTSHL